ncbi:sulfite oxidase [Halalkalibacter urbisdiaboli]|uniref:sulfite oxidase n=1 Tax=Halalkalibacter urbisdiaboli TaxID=1960589 RepID=UPI000B432EFC|nr:sulfite oxidase [Halalkalibacter urbisdiaboli]
MSNRFFPVMPSLTTHSLHPENQESPIHFLKKRVIDTPLFYKRNHFPYPLLTHSNYWLPISGSVKKPTIFSLQDIINLPSKTLNVLLECAGNKRHFFEPKTFGEQWEKGAMSQGYWTGVPLRTLLDYSGIEAGAKEVVFEGYDFGTQPELTKMHRYVRSLPLVKALHPDTMIAYEYNEQPIPYKHGYPLRLIVPQWYGMASVKWVKQIIVIDSSFQGPFQTKDYVYYPHKNSNKDSYPVTTMHVNSTIQQPLHMEILRTGIHTIEGIAWTGQGEISKVEISIDNGETWADAKIMKGSKYEWTTWTYEWTVHQQGEYTILSKATDSTERTQPYTAFWNRKGYGYHAMDHITVNIK